MNDRNPIMQKILRVDGLRFAGLDSGACVGKIDRRVVVLSTDPWLDRLHGASIFSIFRSLTKLGFKVKVLLPSVKNINIENGFFSVMALSVKRYVPLLTLISLYKRALKPIFEEKTAVLIFDPPMLPMFLLAMILRKSKGVMLILSRPLGEKSFLAWLHSLHFKLLLMFGKIFASGFTAISPFEAAGFSRLGKIPEHKIVVIPSPLGEEFEKYSFLKDENELRLKLGLNGMIRKTVLLYQGVLDERRGILEFLEVFANSFKGDDRIILLIIGEGPAKGSIENFITHNRANNIVLLGPFLYSQMPQAIAACDVGLVLLPDEPSWRYQCPTKLIEFLALGKPVIASDLPGIRWIAGDSPLVFYMKEMNISGLQEALRKVLVKKESITVNTMQIRQEMIDRFSSFSVAQMLSQTVCSLCID